MTPPPQLAPGRLKPYLALVAMAAFFSSNLVIGRAAVESTGPWTLACLRWALATACLWPFAGASLLRHRPVLLAQWPRLLALGLLGMIVCGGGVYVALAQTTATNATLIYTSSPAFVVLIAAMARRRWPGLPEVLGLALATLGIAVIVLQGRISDLLAFSFNPGDLGIAAAALSWAVYSVVLRAPAFAAIPTLASFLAIAATGTTLLVPLSALELASGGAYPSTPAAWANVLALALFPSVLAFSLYQYGVKAVGPGTTAMFLYLLPLFGVALAVLGLGEEPRAHQLVGLVLILGGVALATLRPRSDQQA